MNDPDRPIRGCAQGHPLHLHGSVVRWLHTRCVRCGDMPGNGYGFAVRGGACAWCVTRGWRHVGRRGRMHRLICPLCLGESRAWRWIARLRGGVALEDV